jgi:hypothetical protein
LRDEERNDDFWNTYIEDYKRIYPQNRTDNEMPVIKFKATEGEESANFVE